MSSSEGTFDTKLHEAVRYGDLDEVKVALQQGYDPNLIGLYQWSALHEAAHNGETEILKLLLEKKGNPNKADYLQSRTAMHYAAVQGHIDCLRMLIDAGGRYDIKDANGKDSLDLVTPGGRKMLERLKVRDLMQVSTEETHDAGSETTKEATGSQSQTSSDTQSLSSRRSSQDSAIGDKKPVLGYVTLSVEYHSSKGTMKIRVWQLSDLLLPPPNTSMIYTVYVKSYLYPDKKRDSKRKTEEVKVEGSEGHMHLKKHKDKLSAQHVFTPVSFKFIKALEYSGISADIIREKQLQIEVCITQRYSHRSFLIGMLLLPLKKAVKKVVKEKYALIPCMNHTIPTNMRVYSASELLVTSNRANVFYSNPNVRVMIPEDIDDSSEKAVSNPDLKQEFSSSIEVDMVPKLDFSNLTLDESGYSSEHQVMFPGELESPSSDKNKDRIHETKVFKTIDSEIKKNSKAKELSKDVKQKVSTHDSTEGLSTCKVIEIEFGESDADTPREIKIDQGKTHTAEDRNGDGYHSTGSSRPDTPSWDYYDIPIDNPTVVVENPPQTKEQVPVLFPMETKLEMRAISNDGEKVGRNKKEKDRSKRRSKKKQEPVPGKAIPLVPQIVVISPHETLEEQKPDSIKIDVPDQSHRLPNDAGISEDIMTLKKVTSCNPAQIETVTPGLREVTVVKPKIKKLKEAVFALPKMRDINPSAGKNTQPQAPPRSKKTRKLKERHEKELVFNQANVDTSNTGSNQEAHSNSAPVLPTFSENLKFQRSISDSSAFSRSLSSTSNSSVVVDIDKLSFASSDSHVVELEEDISITELPDDSDLFSDDSELFSTSSKVSSTVQKDLEKGIENIDAIPERFSPTKQVIPMQVFVEESFDSSDEALRHSFTKNLPITEL